MGDSTLPGCIGYYGRPIHPNGPCSSCKYADLCQRVVSKEWLKPLLTMVWEIKAIARDEI